jgi:hypothetical protein
MRYRSWATLLTLSVLSASASPLSSPSRQDLHLATRSPLLRRQDHLDETETATGTTEEAEQEDDDYPIPVIGAPHGDFYLSTDKVLCEELRITLGGGSGPPYAIAIVNASTVVANGSVDDVEVLQRIGVMGMPGITFARLEGVEVGTAVALQIVDAAGKVGYSVARHGASRFLFSLLLLPFFSDPFF